MSNTESAQGAMNEFLGASPTKQAKMWTAVGGAVDAGIQKDGEALQKAAPELHATMGGGGAQPKADTRKTDVKAGQGKIDDKKLSPEAPKVKPEPTKVPAAPKVDGAAAMKGVTKDTPVEQKQAQARETIKNIPTTMDGIPRSAGTPPRVQLTGDADPAKAEANRADAEAQAQKGADDLRSAVENGRGPDAVQPLVFDEAHEIRDIAKAKVDTTSPIEGLEKFKKMGVPADVEGAIDEQQQAVMDTALSEARGKMDEAVSTKDAESQKQIDKANTEAEALRQKADSEQEAAVGKARGDITDARDKTLAEQEKVVAELESEAGSRQRQELDQIRGRVAQDEAKIDSAYLKAESDVDKEIAEGEREAEKKKKEAEEEANNRSWWDRVKDAVASAFKALTDAINAVLTAVRDAVKSILDGVKKLASELIDAAAKWITDKLKAFGDWLKSKVTQILGSVFPGLAKKLNEWIDAAVDFACEKVNQLAEELKGAIEKLCDTIAGALDTIVAAFNAAVNFAMALAEAALTGNWAKVGMIVLEGILKLAGIPPEEFYAVIGKAEDTIGIIVDDPGGFLGNCLDAVGLGFGQFSDNFLDHLKNGFVSWLGGVSAEAGITIPGSLDIVGIFDIAMQVTGLNADYLREKLVKRTGEKNAERIDFAWNFISKAMEGGWGGLWEHVQESLGDLWDMVVGGIQDFLMERIIKAAVLKIASMFNPVGAIVQAILTAWNLYEFLRDQIQRIFGVVRAVVDSISDIANGNIGGAANMIENALGQLVPIAIDLLAKLLGLGGIGAKVKEIITKVRAKIDAAIDKMIDKVLGWFKGGDKGKDADKDKDKTKPDDKAKTDGKDAKVDGNISFETGKITARDAELGIASYTITGSARVKKTEGELTAENVAMAKSEAQQAATGAVGKAVLAANSVLKVNGQLGALSETAKASAQKGLAGSKISVESLTITGIVLPPEVQKALDEKAAANIMGAGLGEPITFQAGAETHRLWVAPDGNGVAVMMASIPTKVSDKVQEIRAQIKNLPPEETKKIGALIGKAIAIERQLDKLGNEAKAASAPAAGATGGKGSGKPAGDKTAAINSKQQELAGTLAELLMVLPQDAQKAVFDMDMSLKGENFAKFSKQYGELYAEMGKSADPAEAARIWKLLAETLIKTTEDFNKLRPDGKSIQWDLDKKILDKVLNEFQPLVNALTPAMRELSSKKGSTWAFWSGDPGKDAAVKNGVNALEASALGKAFDGVNMDGKWAMQLWGAMSRAYANFAAEQIAGRTFIGFLGQVPRDQSIVLKIEQPEFKSVTGEKFKATPSISFYGAAALPWQRSEADLAFNAGMQGTYGSGSDMAGVGGPARTENDARAEKFKQYLDAGVTENVAKDATRGKLASNIAPPPSPAVTTPVPPANTAGTGGTNTSTSTSTTATPTGASGGTNPAPSTAKSNGPVAAATPPAGSSNTAAANATGSNAAPSSGTGSQVVGNSKPVANAPVQLGAGSSGLSRPVGVGGGVGDKGLEGGRAPVGGNNGDKKEDPALAVGVPGKEAGGPAAPAGKGDGSGKVQDAGGVGVGDQASSEKKATSNVSKYAAGEAPVGWRGRVEQSVGSDSVNADDPGHTYHILDDGDVISESKPMRVDGRTADKTKRRVGFTPKPKKKTAEQELRDSGKMTSEEVDLMKGAMKKNPRSEEVLDTDGTKKTVAKPAVKDPVTGKETTSDKNADGTTRAPMTEQEKEALLKGHSVLAEGNVEGADMRKVIPNASIGATLNRRGAGVRGSVGLAKNSDGLNAEETIATLGLDYDGGQSKTPSAPGYKKSKTAVSPYVERDKNDAITMRDDVERDGLHYIDFKMTKEMEKNAGVAMSQDLIDKAKGSKDTKVQELGNKAVKQEKADAFDPFAATGGTSSNAMVQKHGPNAGKAFDPVLNQELNLDPSRKATPGPVYDLEAGAQMKRRGNKAGEDKVIATLVEKADKDGKIVKEWELDAGLEKNERGHYKNKMDKAKSDAAATMKKPGESDADYKKRMQERDDKIVAQQQKDLDEAAANGNPFEPGTPEFKSYNKKARQKAKTKSDSTETKPVAVNGDTSPVSTDPKTPKTEAKKVEETEKKPVPTVVAKPPVVAAAETEAKEKAQKAASPVAPDTEAASEDQVVAAKKKDAKSPAEEVEKILSPVAKTKPKESVPPKDFPEPANDTKTTTTTTNTTTTTTTDTTKKVAANPGIRKEHEGTGVEYQEFKGEAFVKGEGDQNDIDPNDVKQGSLGDCYLLGGMAAVSRANPEYIRKLIKDNGDGTYDVTLYIKNNAWDSKGQPKVVTVDSKFPSSDKGLSAKYARFSDKGPKGPELWCMLIEKAWAVHKGTYSGIEGGKVNDDGKFAGAIALLTNLREGYYTPSSIGDKQLAQMISDALTQKKPVACDSKNLDKEPPDLKAAADAAGVVGNHAYAPKSVDLQAMTIELQNPWGSSHVSGLKISDFKRFYRGLRIGS